MDIGVCSCRWRTRRWLVSGFYQHVRDRMQRPILELDYQGELGLNKVEVSYKEGEPNVDDIYIWVRIRNKGRNIARKCVAYLIAIDEVYTQAKGNQLFRGSHATRVASQSVNSVFKYSYAFIHWNRRV
jgi:hypothetical protein